MKCFLSIVLLMFWYPVRPVLAQVVPGTGNKSLKSTNPANSAARTNKEKPLVIRTGAAQPGGVNGKAAARPGDANNKAGASRRAESGKMSKNRAD
jgi:hypothetical protein